MTFLNVSPPNLIGMTPEWGVNPVPIIGTPVWNGTKSMTGVTKDALGNPHQRMVYLYLYPAMIALGRQLSDPSTGSFTWNYLRPAAAGQTYCMTAHDVARSANAGIHDELVPT